MATNQQVRASSSTTATRPRAPLVREKRPIAALLQRRGLGDHQDGRGISRDPPRAHGAAAPSEPLVVREGERELGLAQHPVGPPRRRQRYGGPSRAKLSQPPDQLV